VADKNDGWGVVLVSTGQGVGSQVRNIEAEKASVGEEEALRRGISQLGISGGDPESGAAWGDE